MLCSSAWLPLNKYTISHFILTWKWPDLCTCTWNTCDFSKSLLGFHINNTLHPLSTVPVEICGRDEYICYHYDHFGYHSAVLIFYWASSIRAFIMDAVWELISPFRESSHQAWVKQRFDLLSVRWIDVFLFTHRNLHAHTHTHKS